MCGIAGIAARPGSADAAATHARLERMVCEQHHRGPDAHGHHYVNGSAIAVGHTRLSIIDLSDCGAQPMRDRSGQRWVVFNGEIYNYRELRAELSDYPYESESDTEVLLAAYDRWGESCLDRLIGMFSFALWDGIASKLFMARDRFGVKPLYFSQTADGTLLFASEIRALHAAGIEAVPDPSAWASYLALGLIDHSTRTFWKDIASLPAGHYMVWQDGEIAQRCWYDLAERVPAEFDTRPVETVLDEYLELLRESIRLRFRADVPVGINLSGGLDSSLLLALIHDGHHGGSTARAYSFVTGDAAYDELPWVKQMIAHTHHELSAPLLSPQDVPSLAASVQLHQSEPYGGIPNLAYARLFEAARADGVYVLLDGQGMDEQWAGYDYYGSALRGEIAGVVQGTTDSPVRPSALVSSFRDMAEPLPALVPFPDKLRNLQYRDITQTKIPRALRFNDRVSMRSSVELREPFLDHRLFELALSQPTDRKVRNGTHKWMLRQLAARLMPQGVAEAPKRPVQTPQREWLRGPLREWSSTLIESALANYGGTWLDSTAVRSEWAGYCDGIGSNSFFVWQWISLGLTVEATNKSASNDGSSIVTQ